MDDEFMTMKRSKSQYARLMELDQRIRAGKYPNCLTFAAVWEVSQKTVQRDIDFLRDQCGAPIEYSRQHKGYYYSNETWTLPSIILSEGELLSLMLSSRALAQYEGTPVAVHLERVFRKITGLLPEQISLKPELLYSRFSFRGPPAKPINETVWAKVVQGLLSQRVLRVVYRVFETKVRSGKTSRICPYHLANLQGEWYLFGVHEGYTDVRQFSLARIERAELTRRRFTTPAEFNAEALLDAAFARHAGDGKSQTVRLLFKKDIAEWITERQWHPQQKISRQRNGDIEIAFPAVGLYEVQRWVLSWGHWVKVLAPEALATNVADEVRTMYANQLKQGG